MDSAVLDFVAIEFAYPNIAVGDEVLVVLEGDGELCGVGFVFREADPFGGAEDLGVVLNEYAVEDGSHAGGRFEGAVFVEAWGDEDDVVGLPFAGLASGVGEWRVLLVDGTELSVDVGIVLIRIEYLDFVLAHEVDAGVAAVLAVVTFGVGGGAELEV